MWKCPVPRIRNRRQSWSSEGSHSAFSSSSSSESDQFRVRPHHFLVTILSLQDIITIIDDNNSSKYYFYLGIYLFTKSLAIRICIICIRLRASSDDLRSSRSLMRTLCSMMSAVKSARDEPENATISIFAPSSSRASLSHLLFYPPVPSSLRSCAFSSFCATE